MFCTPACRAALRQADHPPDHNSSGVLCCVSLEHFLLFICLFFRSVLFYVTFRRRERKKKHPACSVNTPVSSNKTISEHEAWEEVLLPRAFLWFVWYRCFHFPPPDAQANRPAVGTIHDTRPLFRKASSQKLSPHTRLVRFSPQSVFLCAYRFLCADHFSPNSSEAPIGKSANRHDHMKLQFRKKSPSRKNPKHEGSEVSPPSSVLVPRGS